MTPSAWPPWDVQSSPLPTDEGTEAQRVVADLSMVRQPITLIPHPSPE